jgi:exopolysaccharide biosynthesis polyprenyl glycosylphosphotransferase
VLFGAEGDLAAAAHARALSGEHDAPRRADARRDLVVQGGYLLAAFVPVLIASLAVDGRSVGNAIVGAAVLGGLWFGCLRLGFAETRTTVVTLGALVAVIRGTLLGFVAVTLVGVWWPAIRLDGLTLAVVGATVFVLASVWEMVVSRHLTPPQRLLLVGPADACANVIDELGSESQARFALVGIVDDDPAADRPLVLGSVAALGEVVSRTQPDLVALVPGGNRPAAFAGLIDSAQSGFRVLELAQFYEYAFGRVPVRDLTRAWFMSVLHLYQRPYSRFTKRATDVVGSLGLFLLTAPLFPVLALFVRLSPGAILIRQVRVGEHGRLFTMYKFRTMRADAERPGQAVWASRDDPRVTGAGRIMRRLRLDELPQIWNVLRGEMSLVGPRPERPEFVEDLLDTVPFWTRRHLVKPGITGWAQVNRGYTANAADTIEKLSYDLWYIRHRSLTVDLVICARTVATALRGDRPAYQKAEGFDPIQTLLQPAGGPPA